MRATIAGLGKVLTLVLAATVGFGCSDEGASAPGGKTAGPQDTTKASGPAGSDPAAASDPSATDPSATPAVPNAVVFSGTQKLCGAAECSTTRYGIESLRELHVYGLWKGVSGDHVELRKYYSPDGSLYYQKLVAFSTDPASADKPFEPSADLPHTATVQLAQTNPSGQRVVWDYLPIGGTWITQHGMTGSWRVEVYLDRTTGTPDVVKNFELAPQTASASL
ncbi:MAG: hypothetical protein IPG96_13025 [Proteobacteria bacterium]|nr:hypothetical protein [Pseudomonadota bacterium]